MNIIRGFFVSALVPGLFFFFAASAFASHNISRYMDKIVGDFTGHGHYDQLDNDGKWQSGRADIGFETSKPSENRWNSRFGFCTEQTAEPVCLDGGFDVILENGKLFLAGAPKKKQLQIVTSSAHNLGYRWKDGGLTFRHYSTLLSKNHLWDRYYVYEGTKLITKWSFHLYRK